ncbi:protein-disulfide reductase DsbD domain-containing protein [Bryobacter aggregatus]|uniref:protein-disulfide reductase DsbD domain-containing protein n=1 Tax=Bryobacter aggregatus TaxID=360054 RepID=UPI00138DE4FB|nr:protein-disulfide reductase DsbD domain-containing protein [Bryobacter aggregatus]
MKKTFLRCLAPLLLNSLFAQGINPVSVEPPQKIVIQRGQSATIKLQAKIEPGYHVNSNKPHEDYLIPLRMTLASDPLIVETVKYPVGHDEKYTFSEKPLNVLTGNFEVALTVKAPANLEPQMHVLLGKLRYQACSDKACLAPKTLEVRITADVR